MKKVTTALADMSKEELLALAQNMGITTPENYKTKPTLISAIKKWEKVKKVELDAADDVAVTGPVPENLDFATPEGASPWAMGYFKGKKIMSKVPVELNGKEYTDVTTEDGVTHRV